MDRKQGREIVGYTAEAQAMNPESWYDSAVQFHDSAMLLYKNINNGIRVSAFNAALSIELILKAIVVKKTHKLPSIGHDLLVLSDAAEIILSQNQKDTLEYLKEILIWLGKYPAPLKEKYWDEYHDVIFEKHVQRKVNGNVHTLVANPETFPSLRNYETIWEICRIKYQSL